MAWVESLYGKHAGTVVIHICLDDKQVAALVKEVRTDEGQEFCNSIMVLLYNTRSFNKKAGLKSTQSMLLSKRIKL
ncbi:hypothetical protein P3T76_011695 [Phytophthora citrophthora]|uniref:Uncharacterized protein n=1 Tax=Phytophthora citrophthora TaxID=4793 RepID=A0AAD9LEX0_9STRA|nr:hypothetical protein P3T76_011695 [Phytophthora citrophthora]